MAATTGCCLKEALYMLAILENIFSILLCRFGLDCQDGSVIGYLKNNKFWHAELNSGEKG